jgi:hypothetical protein
MKIQADLPDDISKYLKIEKVKRNKITQAETLIEILKEKMNGQ